MRQCDQLDCEHIICPTVHGRITKMCSNLDRPHNAADQVGPCDFFTAIDPVPTFEDEIDFYYVNGIRKIGVNPC